MNLDLITLDQLQLFLVIVCRVAGFVVAIPVFSSTQSPTQLKIGLSFALSLLLYPVMSKTLAGFTPNFNFAPVMVLVVSEVLLGTLLALIGRLIFTAVEFGATVIGFQMGFAAANVFDPQSQKQLSLISQFQNVFAILLFLAIDGHHLFLRTAVLSYELLPPGGIDFSGEAIPYLMDLTSHMFTIGVQFSAPVITVLLLSGLILGILSRVFPQLNVFLLSFPINIGTSFVVIALTLNMVSSLIRREFDTLAERFITILNYLNL